MLKRILLATAALSFVAVPVFAGDAMKATRSADTNANGKVEFLIAQHADQVRAEQLIGTKVINRQSEKIGEIDDILFGNNEGIDGAVISVGGFLGVGEKLVAVNAEAVHFQQTQENRTVALVDTSRRQLEDAPSFELADKSYFENVQSQPRRPSDGDGPTAMRE